MLALLTSSNKLKTTITMAVTNNWTNEELDLATDLRKQLKTEGKIAE